VALGAFLRGRDAHAQPNRRDTLGALCEVNRAGDRWWHHWRRSASTKIRCAFAVIRCGVLHRSYHERAVRLTSRGFTCWKGNASFFLHLFGAFGVTRGLDVRGQVWVNSLSRRSDRWRCGLSSHSAPERIQIHTIPECVLRAWRLGEDCPLSGEV